MRLDPKDLVGAGVMAAALMVLVIHGSPLGHPDGHQGGVADAGGSVTSPVGEPITAFVDFNVVPMDRDVVLTRQTLIVRGRTIERIGDVATVEPPPGARIVEGHGSMYLAPGLTDAHVHLQDRYQSWLPLFLANGVTTVFNLEGRPGHLALRRRIAEGAQPGPTIYTAGPYVGQPEVRTPSDARTTVARQAARGYDFVKVHGNLSPETYAELTDAGRELDIPVIGHAPRNLPFSAVLDNHQVAVTHAEELIHTDLRSLDPQAAHRLASRMAEAGTWLTPTLAHFESIAEQWGSSAAVDAALASEEARYLPRSLRERWRASNVFLRVDPADRERIEEMARFHRPLVRALHEAGVPLLAGTDTPIPTLTPGFSLLREIDALRAAGLSGYDALAAATVNPARFVRTFVDAGARFGVLAMGARADILVLDSDPRSDPGALRSLEGVMARGVLYGPAELQRMLEDVAASR